MNWRNYQVVLFLISVASYVTRLRTTLQNQEIQIKDELLTSSHFFSHPRSFYLSNTPIIIGTSFSAFSFNSIQNKLIGKPDSSISLSFSLSLSLYSDYAHLTLRAPRCRLVCSRKKEIFDSKSLAKERRHALNWMWLTIRSQSRSPLSSLLKLERERF